MTDTEPESFLSLMRSEFRWWLLPVVIVVIVLLAFVFWTSDGSGPVPFLYDVTSE